MATSNPVGGAFMSEAMFKAFSSGADASLAASLTTSPAKPPVGSRLVQYMQNPPDRSKTPVFQNGMPPSDPHLMAFHEMAANGALGLSRLTPPNPALTQGLAQMSLHDRPNPHCLTPDAQMMKIHQSVSVPAFQRQLSSSFDGNFPSGSSPPGVQRSIASPVGALAGVHDSSSSSFVQESVGGTTYFYNAPQGAAGPPGSEEPEFSRPQVMQPNFYSYSLPPPHIARLRPKGAGVASFFVPPELKMELINRQLVQYSQVNPEHCPDVPSEVDNYHNITPLEPHAKENMLRPGFFVAHTSAVYKGINNKDGLVYCLRRLLNCRMLNTKCLSMVDMWKKLVHSHVVQLREVFTTKLFGDYSLIFVYDYHAAAETLKFRHFSGMSRINGYSPAIFEDDTRPRQSGPGPKFGGAGLPESLIWTYVVQLSSALRAIHSAGLAARTVEPSKILIAGKSK